MREQLRRAGAAWGGKARVWGMVGRNAPRRTLPDPADVVAAERMPLPAYRVRAAGAGRKPTAAQEPAGALAGLAAALRTRATTGT